MMKQIVKYFDLEILPYKPILGPANKQTEHLRKRKKLFWTILLYLFVCIGVFASYLIDLSGKNADLQSMSISKFITALIIAGVVYPFIYKNAKFDIEKPNVMQCFIAFQYGFFWDTLMKNIKF